MARSRSNSSSSSSSTSSDSASTSLTPTSSKHRGLLKHSKADDKKKQKEKDKDKHKSHHGISPEAASKLATAAVIGLAQNLAAGMSTPPAAASDSHHHGHHVNGEHEGRPSINEHTSLLDRLHLPHRHSSSSRHSSHSHHSHNSYHSHHSIQVIAKRPPTNARVRAVVWSVLTALTIALLVVLLFFFGALPAGVKVWLGGLPRDPLAAAGVILQKAPIIDGHIDLPIQARFRYANNISAIDLNGKMPGHVDIPRLRKGQVGGFFWSVYVECPDPQLEGEDFLGASWRVRDTLEQIDISKLLIEKHSDTFKLALTAGDIKQAIFEGKIAGLIGVEGGHQLGNSIAVLRQYHALGARYVTLTHTCHNAFADSCGFLPGIEPLHGGLSDLGYALIDEMNRLGVLVDLSHTSDATATQALKYSKAPVMWSHSSAREVHDVPRNVPDEVLQLVGEGEGQVDAVVMVNFAPFFVANDGNATLAAVADHVDHIGRVAGKRYVGIGSDFDGIGDTPVGLEDVSKYPALIAELFKRGWTRRELAGLTGGNFLRVFEGAERVARELRRAGAQPVVDLYKKRRDIPTEL